MRQFHLLQTIPTTRLSSVAQYRALHELTRRGSSSRDWRNQLRPQIDHWVNRRQYSINGEFSPAPSTIDGYMAWYWPRTVIFITNPGFGVENSSRFHNLGGNLEMAVEGISRMHEDIGGIMASHPESQQYMQSVYDTSERYLHLTHADNRMQYWPTHVVDASTIDVPANMNQLQRMPRRGGRRGGRRRAQHDEAGPSNQQYEAGPSNQQYEAGPSNQQYEAGPSNPYASGSHHVEASSSSFNFVQNLFDFEPSGSYQLMMSTPPPNLTLSSQDSEQLGNAFNNCYHVRPPVRNTSPVSFGGFDMNVPWDDSETQEIEEGRPRRNIRAPSCGTGGRLGHHH